MYPPESTRILELAQQQKSGSLTAKEKAELDALRRSLRDTLSNNRSEFTQEPGCIGSHPSPGLYGSHRTPGQEAKIAEQEREEVNRY